MKERPLLRLKFAKVSKPYIVFWRGELVAIYPLSEIENRWVILQRLLALRDLLSENQAKSGEIAAN